MKHRSLKAFRIQNLSDAITGKMNVTVAEQDGTTQTFDVDTASLPFLTHKVRFNINLQRENLLITKVPVKV